MDMRFAVKYKLCREKGMMGVTATFSRIIRKCSIKAPLKDDYDYFNWVLIPEWIKQGIVFLPVKDYKNIENHFYTEVYSFTKNEDDSYSFEVVNAGRDEVDEVIIADKYDKFALSLNYEKYIESGKFTLDQLVKQKLITKEIKRKKSLPLPELDFEE